MANFQNPPQSESRTNRAVMWAVLGLLFVAIVGYLFYGDRYNMIDPTAAYSTPATAPAAATGTSGTAPAAPGNSTGTTGTTAP